MPLASSPMLTVPPSCLGVIFVGEFPWQLLEVGTHKLLVRFGVATVVAAVEFGCQKNHEGIVIRGLAGPDSMEIHEFDQLAGVIRGIEPAAERPADMTRAPAAASGPKE